MSIDGGELLGHLFPFRLNAFLKFLSNKRIYIYPFVKNTHKPMVVISTDPDAIQFMRFYTQEPGDSQDSPLYTVTNTDNFDIRVLLYRATKRGHRI